MSASETMAAASVCVTVRTESSDRFLTMLFTANGSITEDNALNASMAKARDLSRIDVRGSAANPMNTRQQKTVGNGMTNPAASA